MGGGVGAVAGVELSPVSPRSWESSELGQWWTRGGGGGGGGANLPFTLRFSAQLLSCFDELYTKTNGTLSELLSDLMPSAVFICSLRFSGQKK